MTLSILIGIQGAGKSTFAATYFHHSHLRLCRDILKTDHRMMVLFHAALSVGAPILLDNTHISKQGRARFVNLALAAGYTINAYYFDVSVDDALKRNALREGKQRVPDKAILGTFKKMEMPALGEGFSTIIKVTNTQNRFEQLTVGSTHG